MKSFMVRLSSIALSIILSLVLVAPAHAAVLDNQIPLGCDTPEQQQEDVIDTCDLGITKLVSVNGGQQKDANDAASAVSAVIKDTVEYQITVSNAGTLVPYGVVTVADMLPAQVVYVGHNVSSGSYDKDTGLWTFNADELPATLTITATIVSAGAIANIAALIGYARCSTECPDSTYADYNSDNNSDGAYVNVSTAQVLAATTTKTAVLADTGEAPLAQSLIATVLIMLTAFVMRKKSA